VEGRYLIIYGEIIVDFRVVSGYNCPSGYERYSAYNWSGTIEGCSCEVNIGIWDYTAVLQVYHKLLREDAIKSNFQKVVNQFLPIPVPPIFFGNHPRSYACNASKAIPSTLYLRTS